MRVNISGNGKRFFSIYSYVDYLYEFVVKNEVSVNLCLPCREPKVIVLGPSVV